MSDIKSLLVGINYKNTDNKLFGAINDTTMISQFMISSMKVPKSQIILCNDDTVIKPTKSNILKLIKDIITEINNDDKLTTFWFHYSGHGSYKLDKNGDEDKQNDIIDGDGLDGYDECLVTIDNESLLDDELNELFSLLNKNKKLICIFDCCHSGTALDLPYKYEYKNNKLKVDNNMNKIKCNAVLLSACKDIELATDAYKLSKKYKYVGAFTLSLLNSFKKKKELKIDYIMNYAYHYLKKYNMDQVPQVSTNKKINNNTRLIRSKSENIISIKIIKYKKYITYFLSKYKKTGNKIYLSYIKKYRNRVSELKKFLVNIF